MNTETRKQLGLPEMPVNANHKREPIMAYETPPAAGMFALYAAGVVSGIFLAVIAFLFVIPNN